MRPATPSTTPAMRSTTLATPLPTLRATHTKTNAFTSIRKRAVLRGGPFFMLGGSDTSRAMRKIACALALMMIGCRDQAPPTPTAEESAQLNEMDNSLNALAKNEERPEANASGPS